MSASLYKETLRNRLRRKRLPLPEFSISQRLGLSCVHQVTPGFDDLPQLDCPLVDFACVLEAHEPRRGTGALEMCELPRDFRPAMEHQVDGGLPVLHEGDAITLIA